MEVPVEAKNIDSARSHLAESKKSTRLRREVWLGHSLHSSWC